MYYFKIAGLLLRIDAQEHYIHKELFDFEWNRELEHEPDAFISFSKEIIPFAYPEKSILKAELLTVYETSERYIVQYNHDVAVECYTLEKNGNKTVIYMKDQPILSPEDEEIIMYSIRDSFFYFMQKKGRIAIHSASIIYNGKVWLFSASSGTGKSTHVNLWEEKGITFEMFNGDVAVCFVENGIAYAAGLPWCGTSGIYCNRIEPLGGIMFLQRYCHNEATKLNSFEGILRMGARCLTPNWNKELVNMNFQITEEIAPKIKLGVLHCTPELEAVEVARTFIDGENV